MPSPTPTPSLSFLLLFTLIFFPSVGGTPRPVLAQPTQIAIANLALERHPSLDDLGPRHRGTGTQIDILSGTTGPKVRFVRQNRGSSVGDNGATTTTTNTEFGSNENVTVEEDAAGERAIPNETPSSPSDSLAPTPNTTVWPHHSLDDTEVPSNSEGDQQQLKRRHHAPATVSSVGRRTLRGNLGTTIGTSGKSFGNETVGEMGSHDSTASERLAEPQITVYHRRQGLIANGSSTAPVPTASTYTATSGRVASANVTVGGIVAGYPTDLPTDPRANLTSSPPESSPSTTVATSGGGLSPTGIIGAGIGFGIFVIITIVLVACFILFYRQRRSDAEGRFFEKDGGDVEQPKEPERGKAEFDEKGLATQRVELIGPWIVGLKIGEGASADVYRAKHSKTGEEAAIKIIDKTKLDDRALVNTYGEVIILDALKHPNVLRIVDLHDFPDRLCIVTELVEDADLFRNVLINGESPAIEQTREWFIQMFLALEFLHHFGIYHRDLKLENVFLSKARNLVKIGDMGLAAFSHPQDLFSIACGTMHYMSPEIIQYWKEPWREGYKGAPADVWALGCMIFVLLTGELPFETEVDVDGTPEFETDVARILTGDCTIPEKVPEEARDLVSRMMTVDADERIRMDEIRYHPWLTQGGVLPRARHDTFDLAEEPVGIPDPDVLNEVEVLLRASKRIDGMIDAIFSPTPTWETRLYFLILRLRAERTFTLDLSHLPERSPSSVRSVANGVYYPSTAASYSSSTSRNPEERVCPSMTNV